MAIGLMPQHEPLRDPYKDEADRQQIAGDHGSPPPNAEGWLDPPGSDKCCRQEQDDSCKELRSIGNRHLGRDKLVNAQATAPQRDAPLLRHLVCALA